MAQKSCINAFNYFQLNSKLNQKKLSSAHGPTCTKRCTATSFLQLSNAYGFARLCASNAHESTINEAQIDNDNWPVTATGFSSIAFKKGPSRGCLGKGKGGGEKSHNLLLRCTAVTRLRFVIFAPAIGKTKMVSSNGSTAINIGIVIAKMRNNGTIYDCYVACQRHLRVRIVSFSGAVWVKSVCWGRICC